MEYWLKLIIFRMRVNRITSTTIVWRKHINERYWIFWTTSVLKQRPNRMLSLTRLGFGLQTNPSQNPVKPFLFLYSYMLPRFNLGTNWINKLFTVSSFRSKNSPICFVWLYFLDFSNPRHNSHVPPTADTNSEICLWRMPIQWATVQIM